MVEFALTLVIFLVFVFFVIDMGLMIYNHNLFFSGVIDGARVAKLGGSNEEIRSTVNREVTENYFPTLLMIASPEKGVEISPEEEIRRVDGTEVTVRLDTTFGISALGLFNVVVTYPISSSQLITGGDDADRDGCKDSLEGPGVSCNGYRSFASTQPRNHDNDNAASCAPDSCQDDYQWNGPDRDPDNDGIMNNWDEVKIAYFETPGGGMPLSPACPTPGAGRVSGTAPAYCPISAMSSCGQGYFIQRPHYPGGLAGSACARLGEVWVPRGNGEYHSPEIWHDGQEALPKYFSRTLPVWHINNSADTMIVRTLQSNYDRDNDGWEDKHDPAPSDPTVP
jgi:hypothetical protein